MKALSVKQPWINLILVGEKTIEVRKKNTRHRGDLLLCASKTAAFDRQTMAEMEREIDRPFVYGQALCVAQLVDSRPMAPGDEEGAYLHSILPDHHAWVLERVRPVVPFDVKGQLGLFEVDDSRIQPSRFALWESVRVTPDVRDAPSDIEMGGWHGRVAEIRHSADAGFSYSFMPDSQGLRQIPREHIERTVTAEESWNSFWLAEAGLEAAPPRDTEEEMILTMKDIVTDNADLFESI